MSLTIFISYKREQDDELCNLVQTHLKRIPGVEVKVDHAVIPEAADHVHARIRRILEECDLVVALLTDDALKSPEIREELILAREDYFADILTVVDKEQVGLLPHFLLADDSNRLDIDPNLLGQSQYRERLARRIAQAVADIQKERARLATDESPRALLKQIGRTIREIRSDYATLHAIQGVQGFRLKVIQEVLNATRDEVQNLASDRYRQNLTLEQNFIVRAGPIFAGASRVYATSIDRVSAFWLDDLQRGNAENYTECQPDDTKRLFVFSSPKSAHNYRNVLAAHYAKYGHKEKGRVFLCTWEQYQAFIKDAVGEGQHYKDLKQKDFGILVFEDAGSRNKETYEATLSSTTLECCIVSSGDLHGRGIERIIRKFDQLAKTRPGMCDDKYGILRWREDYASNAPGWRDALGKLFEQKVGGEKRELRDGHVYHLVFFNSDVESKDLSQAIADEVATLTELRREGGSGARLVKELWFGDRSEMIQRVSVTDGRFEGFIKTKGLFVDTFPSCLLMKFDSVADLEEYYNHVRHSVARERIFKAVDPELSRYYRRLDGVRDPEEKKLIYHAIEDRAARFMVRADYIEHDDLDIVVQGQSKPFSLSKKSPVQHRSGQRSGR